MLNLYDYQSDDYNSIMESLTVHDRVLYQLSTGGGKTVVISQIVNNMMEQEKKFLILVHKERLLRQMVDTLKSLGLWIGHVIRNEHVNLDAMCIVASVGTVMNDGRIDLIKDREFDYIVIDEAHHAVTNSFTKVIEAANHGKPCKIIGVTATPYRPDKKNLKDHFDELIVSSKPMRQLIQDGFLCKYRIAATPVKNLKDSVSRSGSDYRLSELSDFMREPETIGYLVESYKKYALGRKTIVFCVETKHAKQVMQCYLDAGFEKTTYIDSGTKPKEREEIFEGFQSDVYDIIVCIETLTEGVDLPECNCVQLARPTLSLILFLQMVGRGLRQKSDGGDCIILDNAGCVLEFGLPDAERNWQLDSDKNPVVPGEKMLVGRKSDGSLTDNIEDNELDDLFEMDYDDFIEKTIGTVDEANKINEDLKEKQMQIMKEIVDFICAEHNVLTAKSSRWDHLSHIFYNEKYQIFELSVRGSKPVINPERFLSMELYVLIGKVAETIKKNNLFEGFEEKFESLRKKHINIHTLRDRINETKLFFVENLMATNFEKGVTVYDMEKQESNFYISEIRPSLNGKISKIEIIDDKFSKKSIMIRVSTVGLLWYSSTTEEFRCKKENLVKLFKNYDFNK